MRAAIITILLLVSTSVSLADIVTAKGTVKSVDAKGRTITVRRNTASGEKTGSFKIAVDAELTSGDGAIELDSLKEGDAVTLTYDTTAKHLTTIERIEADEPNKGEELFNGRDLTGWGLKKPKTGGLDAMWLVDPERRVLVSPGGNGSNWLESDKSYNDFVLSLEYRFPPGGQAGGNGSGVVIRSAGFTASGFDPRGIEIELFPKLKEDGTGTFRCYESPLKTKTGECKSGQPQAALVPTKFVQKPIGTWNRLEIECDSDRISVKINGELVNEGTGMKILAGRVSLRNQSTAIEFRNIRLGPLTASDPSPVGKWIERRPGTPAGDRIRTFSADGSLLLYSPKSKQRTKGTWRQEGKRVYFSDDPASDAEERFFDIKEFAADHLTIMMEAKREYRWDAIQSEISDSTEDAKTDDSAFEALLSQNGLDGFHFEGNLKKKLPNWANKNGILTYKTAGPSLISDSEYYDFEMQLDFNLPKDCNCGVLLRGRYEVKLTDTPKGIASDLRPDSRIGAIYARLAPSTNAYKGTNQWNELEVKLVGKTVTVKINGETVIDEQDIPPGRTPGAAAGQDESTPGPITFFAHPKGVGAKFRNLKIKRLDRKE